MADINPKTASTFTSPFLLSLEEIRKMGIPEQSASFFQRVYYQYSFSIETWYDRLPTHTFRTAVVEFSFSDAQAMVSHFDYKHERTDSLSADNQAAIDRVTMQLDEVIKAQFPNGAFVKMNTRSPKDVPIYDYDPTPERTQALVRAELDLVTERSPNDIVCAFVKGTNRSLKVNNGEEALQLLLASERVHDDLKKTRDFGEKHFRGKIILREWLDEVIESPAMEFRGFVHENELNALSQYFSFLYFPDLVNQREQIAERIQTFFKGIRHLIPHSSYVIDFVVLRDRVLIIELNPFHSLAGACLFSWKQDRETFLKGPFTFRVTENPLDKVYDLVPRSWLEFMGVAPPLKPVVVQAEEPASGCLTM